MRGIFVTLTNVSNGPSPTGDFEQCKNDVTFENNMNFYTILTQTTASFGCCLG